jgi:hypothetical protein
MVTSMRMLQYNSDPSVKRSFTYMLPWLESARKELERVVQRARYHVDEGGHWAQMFVKSRVQEQFKAHFITDDAYGGLKAYEYLDADKRGHAAWLCPMCAHKQGQGVRECNSGIEWGGLKRMTTI